MRTINFIEDVNLIEEKIIFLNRELFDKTPILSSLNNILTLIFKAVIFAAEKCIGNPDFFKNYKIVAYIKAKSIKECFTLLLPYYGNKWVRESKRAFDLQTCINNPLCFNLDSFDHYRKDWPFLVDLIRDKKFDDFKHVLGLEEVEFLSQEGQVEFLKILLKIDPSLIKNSKYLSRRGGINKSVALELLKQINLSHKPLRENIDLIVKLWDIITTNQKKECYEESIKCLLDREKQFLLQFFQRIVVNNPDILLHLILSKTIDLTLSKLFDMNQQETSFKEYIEFIEKLYHINPAVLKQAFWIAGYCFAEENKYHEEKWKFRKQIISHFVKLNPNNFDYYNVDFDNLEQTTYPTLLEKTKQFHLDLIKTVIEINPSTLLYIKGKKIFDNEEFLSFIFQQPTFYQFIEKFVDPNILKQAQKEILPLALLNQRRMPKDKESPSLF